MTVDPVSAMVLILSWHTRAEASSACFQARSINSLASFRRSASLVWSTIWPWTFRAASLVHSWMQQVVVILDFSIPKNETASIDESGEVWGIWIEWIKFWVSGTVSNTSSAIRCSSNKPRTKWLGLLANSSLPFAPGFSSSAASCWWFSW